MLCRLTNSWLIMPCLIRLSCPHPRLAGHCCAVRCARRCMTPHGRPFQSNTAHPAQYLDLIASVLPTLNLLHSCSNLLPNSPHPLLPHQPVSQPASQLAAQSVDQSSLSHLTPACFFPSTHDASSSHQLTIHCALHCWPPSLSSVSHHSSKALALL